MLGSHRAEARDQLSAVGDFDGFATAHSSQVLTQM